MSKQITKLRRNKLIINRIDSIINSELNLVEGKIPLLLM